MTLAANSPINSYVGTSGANTYAFTFPVFTQSQILVSVVSPAGVTTTLVLGTDYTVTGLNPGGDPASTGSIVLVNSGQAWLTGGNLTTSWKLVIQINVPLAQTTSFRNQGDFYRSALENALDYLDMQIQQLELSIGSQVILPTGLLPSAFSPILPAALAASPGLAIVVNSTGTGFALGAGSSVTLPVTVAQGGTGSTTALVGNRIMKSSGQTIIEAAAIAANRALTSDANGIPVAAPSGLTDVTLGYLLNILSYRRPVLQYSSGTVVNLETGNLGTSGQASIVFPDGKLISDSTSGHINCNLAQVASTGASPQSGLRTGTVSVNTWYAIYAVKANSGTAFVTIADTVLPLQANFATLNSNFGSSSWVYLGLVRNGDNNGITTGILKFNQVGAMTIFYNAAGGIVFGTVGTLLASASAAAGVTYTYAAGTGTAQIPNNISLGCYMFDTNLSSTVIDWTAGSARMGLLTVPASNKTGLSFWAVTGQNVSLTPAANTGNTGLYLAGFVDVALGVGFNPLL